MSNNYNNSPQNRQYINRQNVSTRQVNGVNSGVARRVANQAHNARVNQTDQAGTVPEKQMNAARANQAGDMRANRIDAAQANQANDARVANQARAMYGNQAQGMRQNQIDGTRQKQVSAARKKYNKARSVSARRTSERQRYSERARYIKERTSHVRHRRIVIAFIALVLIALIIVVSVVLSNGCENSSFSYSAITGSVNSEAKDRSLPTPIMAEVDGVQMHCAVAMEDLTELLFHNASYTYAKGMTTQLSEATNTEIMAKHGTGRKASTQPTGNAWMTGQFIRTFRSESAGPQMSAIDCGGKVGAKVFAPVSGEVVLVKEYQLYDQYPDIQIHIRPEGRSDLDCVLIHLQNAKVKQGDKVVAGETELAEIRDVYAYIGDSMQLKEYTAEGDNGNHTHIQMNNANDPEYHGLDDIK